MNWTTLGTLRNFANFAILSLCNEIINAYCEFLFNLFNPPLAFPRVRESGEFTFLNF